jgi:hypothetical protein
MRDSRPARAVIFLIGCAAGAAVALLWLLVT